MAKIIARQLQDSFKTVDAADYSRGLDLPCTLDHALWTMHLEMIKLLDGSSSRGILIIVSFLSLQGVKRRSNPLSGHQVWIASSLRSSQ
jgi:hypothetical protein